MRSSRQIPAFLREMIFSNMGVIARKTPSKTAAPYTRPFIMDTGRLGRSFNNISGQKDD